MNRSVRSHALFAATVVLLVSVAALPARPAAGDETGNKVPSAKLESLRETYDRPVVAFAWGPASLLMTPEETILYTTKARARGQRSAFLRDFWGTMARNCEEGRNPARELFWQRVEQAVEKFGDEPLSGWLTDRGRVWILLGPPEEERTVEARLGENTIEILLWRYPERDGLPTTVAFRQRGLEWFFIDTDPAPAEDDPDLLELEPERFGDLLPKLALHFRAAHACALSEEQKAELATTRWRQELWRIAERTLAGEDPGVEARIEPHWAFFPAEQGATFFWLTFREPMAPADGQRWVALLRGEGDVARYLGTADFPFERRDIGSGGVTLVQAGRSVMPERYAVVVGLADEAGDFQPLWAGRQLVVRLPTDSLRMTSVVLTRAIEPLEGDASAASGPFRFGGFDVVPRTEDVIRHGEQLGVFYQVLGLSLDEAGRADMTITYQFQIRRQGGFINAGRPVVQDHAFGATQAWSTKIVPQWPPTEYRLEITVKDNRTGGTVSASVPFKVQP